MPADAALIKCADSFSNGRKFENPIGWSTWDYYFTSATEDDVKENVDFIAADEVHSIKAYKAERSKALYEFGEAKVKIGATATPIQKDYKDIYGLFKFIKPDLWPSFSRFAGMYIKYVGRGIEAGFKNIDQLRTKISPYLFIKTKYRTR